MIFNPIVSGGGNYTPNLKDFIIKNGEEFITTEQDSGSEWTFETLDMVNAVWAIYFEINHEGVQESVTIYYDTSDSLGATGNFITHSGNSFVFDGATTLRYMIYGVPYTKFYVWASAPFEKAA